MTHHTGSVPDTPRKTDWRDRAACGAHDTELYFSAVSEEAVKAVCRGCPVVEACLQFALTEDISYGVYGGLTQDERADLRRTAARKKLTADETIKRARYARQPKEPRTMRWLYEINTVRVFGGHLAWTGPDKTTFQGRAYTPKQIAFTVGRGYPPQGLIRNDCGTPECILPTHLTDATERGRCGTDKGYQRHYRNGEEICDRCRDAHTTAVKNRRAATAQAA